MRRRRSRNVWDLFPSSHRFRRGLFKSQRLYQAQSAPQVLWKLMPHFYGATMAAKSVKTTFVQKCFFEFFFFSIFWEEDDKEIMAKFVKSVCKNFVADFIPKLESWELRRKLNDNDDYITILIFWLEKRTRSLAFIGIELICLNYCILTAHRELLPLWYPHRQCRRVLHPHLLHLRRSFVLLRL